MIKKGNARAKKMCFMHLKNFSLIFITTVLFNILNGRNGGYSVSLNSSDEIKKIFHGSEIDKQNQIEKEVSRNGNFAEGGVIKEHGMSKPIVSNENSSITFRNKTFSLAGTKNVTDLKELIIDKISSVKHEIKEHQIDNNTNDKSTTIKSIIPTKFNETGTDLFLGVPEVVHINGTSSIKPRKGVYYNKIVPRKGVDNDNEGNYTVPLNDSCFSLTENECHTVLDSGNIKCFCCKVNITDNFKHPPVIKCSSCKEVNIPLDIVHSCQNICCENNVNSSKLNEVKPVEEKHNKTSESTTKILVESKSNTYSSTFNFSHSFNNTEDSFVNLTKKLKPQITKVPCEIKVVSESLENSKMYFIPVAASTLLLPMIGILCFFIWRRTKDYWEKRYYRRMDFLIDGMYND